MADQREELYARGGFHMKHAVSRTFSFSTHELSQRKWDKRWMDMCELAASWSVNPGRKVGAVIIGQRREIISLGWNGIPRGCADGVEERYVSPAKHLWHEHAERNAIYNAAANGTALLNATLYTSLYPCADCARAIIQSGIVVVVCPEPDWNDRRYAESFKVARQMFLERGTTVRFFKKESSEQ